MSTIAPRHLYLMVNPLMLGRNTHNKNSNILNTENKEESNKTNDNIVSIALERIINNTNAETWHQIENTRNKKLRQQPKVRDQVIKENLHNEDEDSIEKVDQKSNMALLQKEV